MNNQCLRLVALTLFAAALAGCHTATEPVDYVDPYIGNISHLLVPTFPTVQLPNSLMRVFPKRADYTSEYLDGFPIMVANHRENSPFTLSVTTGAPAPVVRVNWDNEKITPYSYEADVADCSTHVSFSVSHQSAIYSFVFPEGSSPFLILSSDGSVSAEGRSLSGEQLVEGKTRVYVYLETDCEPVETVDMGPSCKALKYNSSKVNARYGISLISTEQAKANLRREIDDFDTKAVAEKGRRIWNETLGKIRVEGSETDKRIFYTSLYRNFERPVCLSEDGHYWSAFDGTVHEDGGVPFYNDDWIWDTYRASHPLRIMLEQEKEEDILSSYLRMAEQMGTGWMPTFPGIGGDSRRMNCNHAIASFADALVKGISIDTLSSYEASRKALEEKTLIPWRGCARTSLDDFYWQNGWFPALRPGEPETVAEVDPFEKRQPVAVSLGTAYDCWCLSLLADAAGDAAVRDRYLEYSQNYRKLFKPETGFFHPKDSEGGWIEPLDYNFPGGLGGREYYDENNAWEYRWDVQHDIPGLVALMGGEEKFCAALDSMYAEPLGRIKFEFIAKYPDHTGNVGQFSMANEPGMHVPYLYNYAGAPWKTQKRVRQMLKTWFRDDLMGVPGDEDGGGLSAFVVWSMLGFYPVTPGLPEYSIGSPVFSEAEITLSNGNVLRIKAKNVSEENKYIQSATFNGRPFSTTVLSHEDVMKGGTLVFEMGPEPNPGWGI